MSFTPVVSVAVYRVFSCNPEVGVKVATGSEQVIVPGT